MFDAMTVIDLMLTECSNVYTRLMDV